MSVVCGCCLNFVFSAKCPRPPRLAVNSFQKYSPQKTPSLAEAAQRISNLDTACDRSLMRRTPLGSLARPMFVLKETVGRLLIWFRAFFCLGYSDPRITQPRSK